MNTSNSKPKVSKCEAYLHQKLKNTSRISFCDYMQIALYHPSYGYYASAEKRVGKEGDFFTSVSVGSAFGEIIAHRLAAFSLELQQSEQLHIIELGANDASLCTDILTTLKQLEVPAIYHIIEPLPALQQLQQQQLSSANIEGVKMHSSLADLILFLEKKQVQGVILSNELLDAFPVELIKKSENGWLQGFVRLAEETLELSFSPIEKTNKELINFSKSLPTDLPLDYVTEFRPRVREWLKDCFDVLKTGLVLSFDYGFLAEEYYQPKRTEGTLQGYFQHEKTKNPFIRIGEQDLTAHVDFSQVQALAREEGFQVRDFSPQYRYLVQHGVNWLKNLERNFNQEAQASIKQFQTLTHPSMMGTQFFALELEKI